MDRITRPFTRPQIFVQMGLDGFYYEIRTTKQRGCLHTFIWVYELEPSGKKYDMDKCLLFKKMRGFHEAVKKFNEMSGIPVKNFIDWNWFFPYRYREKRKPAITNRAIQYEFMKKLRAEKKANRKNPGKYAL